MGLFRCIAAGLAAIIVSGAAAQAWSAPRAVTIAEILAHPQTYARQTVRIRGQMDVCSGFDCALCQEAMTPATFDRDHCLAVSFEGFEHDGHSVAYRMEEMFRFATVTLDAVVRPDCLAPHERELPDGTVDEIVCMDRASVLIGSRVVVVHGRKTSDTGLNVGNHGFPLSPAPLDVKHDILAAYGDAKLPFEGDDRLAPAVFIIDRAPEMLGKEIEAAGFVCTCTRESCEGAWPKHWIRSEADPFQCQDVVKWSGRWRVIDLY
jgi:hypothetical protein